MKKGNKNCYYSVGNALMIYFKGELLAIPKDDKRYKLFLEICEANNLDSMQGVLDNQAAIKLLSDFLDGKIDKLD